MSNSQLPAEVWRHVASQLVPGKDISTIAAMSSVSRSFNTICQAFLYHTITARQLKHDSFAASLQSKQHGALRQACVREITVEGTMHQEALAPSTRNAEDLIRLLRQRAEEQWNSAAVCLAICSGIRTFQFSVHCDRTSRNSQIFIPHRTSLLQLPLVKTIKHLVLTSSTGIVTDMSSFGHLLLACPLLQELSLHLIDPTSLLQPLIRQSDQDPSFTLKLSKINWNELCPGDYSELEDTWTFEPNICLWARLSATRHYSFRGDIFNFEEPQLQSFRWSQILELEMEQRHPYLWHIRPDWLSSLGRLFPSLRYLQLTNSWYEMRKLDLTDLVFYPNLTHLVVLTQQWLPSYVESFKSQFLTLAKRLLNQHFAPNLQDMVIRLDNRYMGAAHELGIEQGLKELGNEDLKDTAHSLQRIRLECGPLFVEFRRAADRWIKTSGSMA